MGGELEAIIYGYAEVADPDVLAELAWDGLRRFADKGLIDYEEAERQFYERHTVFQQRQQEPPPFPLLPRF